MPFSRRLASVAIALVALVATSWVLLLLLPPLVPKGVAAKLQFFAQHKDEFDTLFVGTSRFYYSVSPEIFDRTTRDNGVSTRTFNFGIDGMHPPENFYVLEQILKTNPRNLKWVFIEIGDIQTKWDNALGTERVVYWHDWPRTSLMLGKALNPRNNTKWFIKPVRPWIARREFVSNLMLFGKRFANVGRAADFDPFREDQRLLESNVELGPRQDGYRPAGAAMSAERAVDFQNKLAQETSRARPKFIDPYAEKGYRQAAAQIRRLGATPIFVVTPVLLQSELQFRQSPPPGALLSFNNSRTYPFLYDTKVRIDDAHLTVEGAEEFTRLLAREFVRQTR
jgi:hypothetical protein